MLGYRHRWGLSIRWTHLDRHSPGDQSSKASGSGSSSNGRRIVEFVVWFRRGWEIGNRVGWRNGNFQPSRRRSKLLASSTPSLWSWSSRCLWRIEPGRGCTSSSLEAAFSSAPGRSSECTRTRCSSAGSGTRSTDAAHQSAGLPAHQIPSQTFLLCTGLSIGWPAGWFFFNRSWAGLWWLADQRWRCKRF